MTQLSFFEERERRPYNGSSVDREAEALTTYVQRLEFSPHTFVIIVCRHGTVEAVANKLRQKKEERAIKLSKNFAIGVVDELRFSAAIAEANDLLIYDNLVIIASSFIQDLYFNVGLEIIDLRIYQCVIDHDSQEYLMLDGLSTFRRNAIQCWEDKQHDSKFWLGPGVVIRVDPRKGQWTRLYEEPQTKSESNRDRLRSYVEEMDNIKIEGRWWNQFRGPIAGIICVLTGAIKLASSAYIKASPRGLFVSYGIVGEVLDIAVGVAGMKVGAALGLTPVGSAILVSAGVAAAIYFIPWESVFDWLETIVSWLQKGIKTIWEKIKDWLADLASTIRDCLMPEEKLHRPFAFPA